MSLAVSGNGGTDSTPSLSHVLRIIIERADDHMRRTLILGMGAEFVSRSPTFSDLLRRLRDAPHVLLYLRFAQLRLPPPSGRTRFEVAPSGLVVGFIEIDTGPAFPRFRQGAIVAHELAHAYEVSCLSHVRTTDQLLQKLQQRAAADGRGDPTTETQFATALENAVLDEWASGSRTASQLPALSAKHDLLACLSRKHLPLSSLNVPELPIMQGASPRAATLQES
jgi:hypothetical protein